MSRSQRQRENRQLIDQLRLDARRIAYHFGLSFRCVDAERANVRSRYGICYSDGTIRIRLRHATSGKPLRYSSLVNTLCHELAHLRHFNHGDRFKRFYLELLGWARQQGIYRPSRPGRPTEVPVGSRSVPPLPAQRPPPLRPRVPAPAETDPAVRQPEQLTLF